MQITKQFKGCFNPVHFHNTSPGSTPPIISLGEVRERHIPVDAIDEDYFVQLEYIQLNYNIKSLIPVPGGELPIIDDDLTSRTEKASKLMDFYSNFNPSSGHAIEIALVDGYIPSGSGSSFQWRDEFIGEYLFNTGNLWNYLNLLSPYLIKDGDVVFYGPTHSLGIKLKQGFLSAARDRAIVRCGYSGQATYFYRKKIEIQTNAGGVNVGTSTTQTINENRNRRRLYVGNTGETPLYFRFTNTPELLNINNAPFIPPKESLTIENGKIFYSGASKDDWGGIVDYYITQPMYCIRPTGLGRVVFEEHYEVI
jgi:hypothetical protein